MASVEVDLSSVDKHIFNEDENCDWSVAELNPNRECDDEESENEDVRNYIELIDLKDILPSIARHRALNVNLIIQH